MSQYDIPLRLVNRVYHSLKELEDALDRIRKQLVVCVLTAIARHCPDARNMSSEELVERSWRFLERETPLLQRPHQ